MAERRKLPGGGRGQPLALHIAFFLLHCALLRFVVLPLLAPELADGRLLWWAHTEESGGLNATFVGDGGDLDGGSHIGGNFDDDTRVQDPRRVLTRALAGCSESVTEGAPRQGRAAEEGSNTRIVLPRQGSSQPQGSAGGKAQQQSDRSKTWEQGQSAPAAGQTGRVPAFDGLAQRLFIGWTGNSTGKYGRTFVPSHHLKELSFSTMPFNMSQGALRVYNLNDPEALCQSYYRPCPNVTPCYAAKGSWACHTALEPHRVCRWRENTVHQFTKVYLTLDNVVFDRKYIYALKRCRKYGTVMFDPAQKLNERACTKVECSVPAGSPVMTSRRAISLIHPFGTNWYHKLTETLPLLLDIAAFLRDDPDIPIAITEYQNVYSLVNAIGEGARDLRYLTVTKPVTMLVEQLLVPSPMNCVRPSRQVVYEMRRRYYLHPLGFPLFHKDWVPREHPPLSDEEMSALPSDWVVVLAQRKGKRSLDKAEEIKTEILRLFGEHRLVIFEGEMDVLDAKSLFNRAALFVGGHGAALTNVQFMPSNSFLLEVLPDQYLLACYRLLADFSDVHYFRSMGKGGAQTAIQVNLTDVFLQLHSISSMLQRVLTM